MKVTKIQRIIASVLTFMMVFTLMPTLTNEAYAAGQTEVELERSIDTSILSAEEYLDVENNTNEADTQFIYQILDKNGVPVEDALVSIEVDKADEEAEHEYLEAKTDIKGIAVIEYTAKEVEKIYSVSALFNGETIIAKYEDMGENNGKVINTVAASTTSAGVSIRRLYGTMQLKEQTVMDSKDSFLQFIFHIQDERGNAVEGAEVVMTLDEIDKTPNYSTEYTGTTDETGTVYFYDAPGVNEIDYFDYLNKIVVTYKDGENTYTKEVIYNQNIDFTQCHYNDQGVQKRRLEKTETLVMSQPEVMDTLTIKAENTAGEAEVGAFVEVTLYDRETKKSVVIKDLTTDEEGKVEVSFNGYDYVTKVEVEQNSKLDAEIEYVKEVKEYDYLTDAYYSNYVDGDDFADTITLKRKYTQNFFFPFQDSRTYTVNEGNTISEEIAEIVNNLAISYEDNNDEDSNTTKFAGWTQKAKAEGEKDTFIAADKLAELEIDSNEEYDAVYDDCYTVRFISINEEEMLDVKTQVKIGESLTAEEIEKANAAAAKIENKNYKFNDTWFDEYGEQANLASFVINRPAVFIAGKVAKSNAYEVKYVTTEGYKLAVAEENENITLSEDKMSVTYKTLKGIAGEDLVFTDSEDKEISLYEMKVKSITVDKAAIEDETLTGVITEVTTDGTVLKADYSNLTFAPLTEIVIEVTPVTNKMVVRPVFEWYNQFFDMSEYLETSLIDTRFTEINDDAKTVVNGLLNKDYHYYASAIGTINGKAKIEKTNTDRDELIIQYWTKEVRVNYNVIDEDGKVQTMEGKTAITRKAPFIDGELEEMTDVKYSEVSDEIKAILKDSEIESIEIDGTDEEWVLDEENTTVTAKKREGGANHVNVIIFNLVFKKAPTNPLTLNHILWYYGEQVGEVLKTEEISKVKDIDLETATAEEIFEAYKGKALDDAVLDEKWLGNNSISYDEETNTLTFKYWARKITVKYVCDAVNNIKTSVTVFVNYTDFDEFKTDEKSMSAYKEWLEEKGLTDSLTVAFTGYSCADIKATPSRVTQALPWTDEDAKDAQDLTLTLVYKEDKSVTCSHQNTEYKTVNDGDKHALVCSDCNKRLESVESHDYNGGYECKDCGHINKTVRQYSFEMPKKQKFIFNNKKSAREEFNDFIKKTVAPFIAKKIQEDNEKAIITEGLKEALEQSSEEIEQEIFDRIKEIEEKEGGLKADKNGKVSFSFDHISSVGNFYDLQITIDTNNKNFVKEFVEKIVDNIKDKINNLFGRR